MGGPGATAGNTRFSRALPSRFKSRDSRVKITSGRSRLSIRYTIVDATSRATMACSNS